MSSESIDKEFKQEVDNIVSVPDIPLPTIGELDIIQDEFKGASKFAIVGLGQGGSHIAETFWKLGYQRVCVLNTAKQDLNLIDIPEDRKMLIPGGGAGKNMEKASAAAKENYEDILDFLRRGFKSEYDRILICLGAGGGTGAGTLKTIVNIAHDLNISLNIKENRVGVLIALPTDAEGRKVARNSLKTIGYLLEGVRDKTISPFIILDNQRIRDVYPGLAVSSFWSTANKSICMLFHLFNTIACEDSKYTSFDGTDLEAILDSGVITFGATALGNYSATDISYAIRDNLKRNVLTGGLDLHQGSIAGCVVIGHKEILDKVPQENIEHGFEQLNRMLGKNSTVHRGIYQGDKEGLVIYTVIGGLGSPKEKIQVLRRIADYSGNSIYDMENE